jgi:hypothetical protein
LYSLLGDRNPRHAPQGSAGFGRDLFDNPFATDGTTGAQSIALQEMNTSRTRHAQPNSTPQKIRAVQPGGLAKKKKKRKTPKKAALKVAPLSPPLPPATAPLVPSDTLPEHAVYTFSDGTREQVRVVKAHSEGDGGGYTIFIASLQRERQTVEERLDFSQDRGAMHTL